MQDSYIWVATVFIRLEDGECNVEEKAIAYHDTPLQMERDFT